MKIKSSSLAWLIFFLSGFFIMSQDIPPATTLVYPGTDGRLVYIADSLGNKIPDFSNAGYLGEDILT